MPVRALNKLVGSSDNFTFGKLTLLFAFTGAKGSTTSFETSILNDLSSFLLKSRLFNSSIATSSEVLLKLIFSTLRLWSNLSIFFSIFLSPSKVARESLSCTILFSKEKEIEYFCFS